MTTMNEQVANALVKGFNGEQDEYEAARAATARAFEARNLDELFTAMRAPGAVWASDFPTFGGADVRNTTGVWSWDATRKIVGTCAQDLQIVAREDEDAEVQS